MAVPNMISGDLTASISDHLLQFFIVSKKTSFDFQKDISVENLYLSKFIRLKDPSYKFEVKVTCKQYWNHF